MNSKPGKLKRFAVALTVALLCFAFTACSAGVDVYESGDDDNLYYEIHVNVDPILTNLLESGASATFDPISGEQWKVKSWLIRYFDIVAGDVLLGTQASYLGSETDTSRNTYRFLLTVPYESPAASALSVKTNYDVKTNFFLQKVNAEGGNVFNVFQKEFTEAYARYQTGKDAAAAADYASAMGMVLFGARTYYGNPTDDEKGELSYDEKRDAYYKETLPALDAAFTQIDMTTFSNMVLRNFKASTRKMQSNATKKIKMTGSKKTWYMFEKTMGSGASTELFRYYVPDSRGWYVLAFTLGGLAVLTVLLVCRYRKKNGKEKEQVKDLFPYDPFDGQY